MADVPDTTPEESLEAWEQALTIHTGLVYACRTCGNRVVITHGGVGNLELTCCGKPMSQVNPDRRGPRGGMA